MTPPDLRDAEALLGFWREAGVDALYEDAPVDRTLTQPKPEVRPLRPAAPAPRMASSPAGQRENIDVAALSAEARKLALEANDLDALKALVGEYAGCPLRFEGAARQAVFGRGNPKADILIIGEAPGAEEDVQGAPFVGRAGKLLDRMLASVGLSERVYITNTVYWRPPGNRTPSPQEQATCAPFLERTIAIIQPQILVCAGGASAKAVLKRTEGILALRGNWYEWTSQDGSLTRPVLPMLHPAFLLRTPQAKKKAWFDLLSLAGRLDQTAHAALQTEM
ncbi:MAG TPA: uracil-DNA glycosylase [Caulobacteraceae bacterium]|jgi:DNA polymerase|nr:uracil-DNA glycosylase [Caulobacteraceae bacterium]